MRHGDYLYRRNGRFYARLRIPRPLQAAYGRSDLRTSLETTSYGQARSRVLETVLGWKRAFLRLQAMLDARQVVAGSALLVGDGLIPLESAARECGLRVDDMLREAINRSIELRLEALGWRGTEMAADALEYDDDGSLLPADSAAAAASDLSVITGALYLRRESLPLVSGGAFQDCVFYRDARRRRAVVVALPGVSVPVGSLLIAKVDAEAMRLDLAAGVTPAMLQAATNAAAQPSHAGPVHKYGTMRASALLAEFFKAKRPGWSPATEISMCGKDGTGGMCGVFVELMNNPTLSEIDGVMMLEYQQRLLTLPADLDRTRRRLKTTTLAELVEASTGLPRMPARRADEYLTKISEAFGWAVRRDFMTKNPAAGVVERKKKTERDQDQRDEFSDENLGLIFSAPWFTAGKGKLTRAGTYRDFQPFYFWLPVIAIFTGGRLNELAQLHLKDITLTAAGTWFIDFNLVGGGKIDEPDKRLKTVNSIRKVPMHPELVRLGLPGYAQALADAGYERLFPELRHDRVKGYGRAAGTWFNERFLGNQLKILRDGKQTFHSLRHGFVNGFNRLEPPLSEFTVNQLSGHERGETMSGGRYAKDQGPDALRVHVDRLKFNVPTIAPFDVAEGLVAVGHALERKSQVRGRHV